MSVTLVSDRRSGGGRRSSVGRILQPQNNKVSPWAVPFPMLVSSRRCPGLPLPASVVSPIRLSVSAALGRFCSARRSAAYATTAAAIAATAPTAEMSNVHSAEPHPPMSARYPATSDVVKLRVAS